MAERLSGVETEYALTGFNARGRPIERVPVLRALMHRARQRFPHVLDGTGRGMFLPNGARFYVDYPDHLEFSTPECANPWDAVRYVQAGDRIVTELAAELVASRNPVAEVVTLRCNVDYSGERTTWGCHESYLHRTDPAKLPRQMIPYLCSRLCWSGAGGWNSHCDRGLHFTLSPRVWHLEHEVSGDSTGRRGIYHTKNESHSSCGYHRLHLLCGESLCSETAAWLKVGATALVVAMIDGGVRPGEQVQLAAPLEAMRTFASDPACRVAVPSPGGRDLTALDIQRHYLSLAEAHVGAPLMPPWAEEVCRRWRAILEQLEEAPGALATVLDWPMKLEVFKARAQRGGIDWESLPHWNHVVTELDGALARVGMPGARVSVDMVLSRRSPIASEVRALSRYLDAHGLRWDGLQAFVELRQTLFEADARFGQLGDNGIFGALDRAGVLGHRVPGVDNIEHAVQHPPQIGRARLRGEAVRQLSDRNETILCDWSGLWDCENQRMLDLGAPFATTAEWQPWSVGTQRLEDIRGVLRDGIRL